MIYNVTDVKSDNKESKNVKVLKDGSSAYVKILKKLGNNRYEASVAGVKTQVKSDKILQPGSAFLARVTSKNNTILLSLEDRTGTEEFSKNLSSQEVVNLLKNFNLPVDDISVLLLKQFKQLELRYDSSLLKKIRNIASKFKGKEKNLVQILSLLEKNNLTASLEEFSDLLDDSDSSEDKDYTLFNKINAAEKNWFLIPFNIFSEKENKVTGNGFLRLFFREPENLSKMLVNLNYEKNLYWFSLSFENKKLNDIKCYFEREDGDCAQTENYFENLKAVFKKYCNFKDILLVDKDYFSILDCSDEELFSVNGVV